MSSSSSAGRDDERQQSRMAILEGIARGEQALADGRTLTHAQVKEHFAKKWLR